MKHSKFYNTLVKDGTLLEYLQYAEDFQLNLVIAFTWSNTPSKSDYWSNLAEKLNSPSLSPYDIKVSKNAYPEYFI